MSEVSGDWGIGGLKRNQELEIGSQGLGCWGVKGKLIKHFGLLPSPLERGVCLLPFALGASLGFERQWRQRMAGLLTNTLVSVGACLFVMLSV